MKYIVKETVELWKWVEADNREEAIKEAAVTNPDHRREIKITVIKDKFN